jgi:chitinase
VPADELGAAVGQEPGGGVATGTTSGAATGTTTGATTGTTAGGESCALLCETEAASSGGACTAPAWQEGTAYVGGETVSRNGSEYTSVYWTDTDPATASGPSGSGQPWSEGRPCADGVATPSVELVCCPEQPSDDDTVVGEPGSGVVSQFLSKAQFETFFPNRNALYTYENFVAAVAAFPAFAGQGSDEVRKRELAAFLANIAHETSGGWPDAPGGPYVWGLYFKEEVGCEGGCPGYCVSTPDAPCAPGKSYHGRGPIQLSYNYNYKPAGDAIGANLLAQPELVATDGAISFKTALWFWMGGLSGGAQTCHEAMVGGLGFGATIRIINGIECGGAQPSKVDSRVGHYEFFCDELGVTPGDALRC